MQTLEATIKTILPKNSYFTLENGEQSFVVYPTNHVKLENDFLEIEVAVEIYGTVTQHDLIMDNLQTLYRKGLELSEILQEYVCILPVDNNFRLIIGGLDTDQTSIDFNSIDFLVNYIDQL
jgi:hypothetical protein